MMKVILEYVGGPADGAREELDIQHPDQPFNHRIRTTVADEAICLRNPAHLSLYMLTKIYGPATAPVWVFQETHRMTMADYRQWEANQRN